MAAGTLKLAVYNTLADNYQWVGEGGLTKPPTLGLLSGTLKTYTNITATADLLALIKDGDQNIPLFFTTTSGAIQFNFGAAFIPKFIAIINHNCYASGDHIEIRKGVGGATLVYDITSPNRSVDLFYPLRFNDTWYNSGASSGTIWAVKLIKASGNPYVGEIIVASDYHSFEEWEPTMDWPINIEFARQSIRHEIEAGSDAIYDAKPPQLTFNLSASLKEYTNDSPLLQHVIKTSAAAQRFTPYKQILVWQDDRVCLFGKLSTSASYQHSSADLAAPSHQFIGEYPRRFYRDEIFD